MKARAFLLIILVVMVISIAILMRQPSLEDWAHQAPLERVTVSSGQTITELIRDRVPEGVRAQGDMTEVVSIIEARQGHPLGSLQDWEEILLPVSYAEWHK